MAAKNADPSGADSNFDDKAMEGGAQDFIATCGVCHPGGGLMEEDRNGNDYSATSPPGDYYIFRYPTLNDPNPGITPGYMSATNKAEMDCLLCHLDFEKTDGTTGHGRALMQSWGCGPGNEVGPANDKDCNGVLDAGATVGFNTAAPFASGTSYDMYNRNLAIKSERLDLAASMALGAKGVRADGTTPVGTGAVGIDAVLAGIRWIDSTGAAAVPAAIPGSSILGTPKSGNCAPCHARDEDTIGLKGMYSMKTGFGNYLLSFAPGEVLDTDNASGANDVAWFDFGCKTGMGKRAHKIGKANDALGQNLKYGRTWFFPSTVDDDPATTPNVGDPIVPASVDPATGLAQLPIAPGQTHLVNPGAMMTNRPAMKMPDIDVHDKGGMSCATCHYAIGTIDADTDMNGDGTLDAKTIPAGEHHHVEYPAEVVGHMDHQFAQGDSVPDAKGKNNLDGTVSCESCHTLQGTAGEHPRVASMTTKPTVPTHATVPAFHLDKIACSTCHIPEAYNAPGRLKYRDWSVGVFKGGFRHTLDWNYDLVTGSHRPSPIVHQWITKFGETKIYPVLPSVMPIWFEALDSSRTEIGSDDGTTDGLDPDGTPYPLFADKFQPMMNRDVTNAALMVQNLSATGVCGSMDWNAACSASGDPNICMAAAMGYDGVCGDGFFNGQAPCMTANGSPGNPECMNRFDIRLNGGNAVPVFDGFSLADAWEIDTAQELDAMIGVFQMGGHNAKLTLNQANFDVTHGVVPSEWALGGAMRGGCVSCHSSKAPNVNFATGMPTNPNYSPYSVGFFEGFQQPMEMAGQLVGGYDVVRNWLSLFSSFNCTEVCGMNPMLPETTFFEASGVPKWGTACAPNSMVQQLGFPNVIDSCVGMMTMMFDNAMQFPQGTAMNMGMYDGVAGLAGFVIKEGVEQGHNGCDPFAGPVSLSTYGAERNANNCATSAQSGTSLINGTCVANTCATGAAAGAPCSADADCPAACADGFRMGKIATNLADCQGVLAPAKMTTDDLPSGTLIYTRAEVKSHFGIDLQQTANNNGVAWTVSGEKNPANLSHVNSWDQAQVCVDRDTMPIDYLGFVPGTKPCNQVFPSADMMGMLTGNPTSNSTCGQTTLGKCDGGKFMGGYNPMTQTNDHTCTVDADCPWGMNDGQKHISTIIPSNKYLGYNNHHLAALLTDQTGTSSYFGSLTSRFGATQSTTVTREVTFTSQYSECPASTGNPPVFTCTKSWNFGDGTAVVDNAFTVNSNVHPYAAPSVCLDNTVPADGVKDTCAGNRGACTVDRDCSYDVTMTVTDPATGMSDTSSMEVEAMEIAPEPDGAYVKSIVVLNEVDADQIDQPLPDGDGDLTDDDTVAFEVCAPAGAKVDYTLIDYRDRSTKYKSNVDSTDGGCVSSIPTHIFANGGDRNYDVKVSVRVKRDVQIPDAPLGQTQIEYEYYYLTVNADVRN